MTYEEFVQRVKKYPVYKLYATSGYVEELIIRLKRKGQIWAWANIGWEGKKELSRLS